MSANSGDIRNRNFLVGECRRREFSWQRGMAPRTHPTLPGFLSRSLFSRLIRWSAGIGTPRVLLTLHSSGVRDVGATEAGVQEVRSIARAIDEGIATSKRVDSERGRNPLEIAPTGQGSRPGEDTQAVEIFRLLIRVFRLIRLIRDSDKIITRPQHLNHGNHHNHMNHSSDGFAAARSFHGNGRWWD